MSTWIKNNVSVLITVLVLGASMVGQWSMNEARLSKLEEQVSKNSANIETLRERDVSVQVALTRIQTDLEYIKAQLDRAIR